MVVGPTVTDRQPDDSAGQAPAETDASGVDKADATALRYYMAALALIAFALGLTVGVVFGSLAQGAKGPEGVTAAVSPLEVITPAPPPPGQTGPTAIPQQETSQPSPAPIPARAPGPPALARLSGGSGSIQGEPFTLPGGPIKVRYQTTGTGLTASLLDENGMSKDSFPCPGPCSRETELEKPAGTYYLQVDAIDGSWTVEVTP